LNINKQSYHQKKGFTIVETIVALSILIIVFSAAVTLVITAVNLVVSTRNKTEAVTLAQEGLADIVQHAIGRCAVSDAVPLPCPSDYPSCTRPVLQGGVNFEITVNLSKATNTITAPEGFVDIDKFQRATATVTWNERGAGNSYQLTQLIKVD
jgi:type II secretory pathway pseudopilin PulG